MSEPMMPQSLMNFAKYSGKCIYCGRTAGSTDHLTPKSKGGTNAPSNLAPACWTCNLAKGNLYLDEFLSRFSEAKQALISERIAEAISTNYELMALSSKGK